MSELRESLRSSAAAVPHEFVDMATFHTTEIGTMNVQVRIGGDMALMRGVAKAVLEAAEKEGGAKVILSTASESKSMSELIGGLCPRGRMIVAGAGTSPIDALEWLGSERRNRCDTTSES